MTLTIILALVFTLIAVGCGAVARSALRARRPLSALIRGLSGLVFLLLAALLGTITVGVQGYKALTLEQVAATVKTEPIAPQRFRATITLPDNRLAMYEIAGDAFYVDAHILKWHSWANILGLNTAYELDRVAGRYNDIAAERTQPHTVYSLAHHKPFDLFFVARRTLLSAAVDAEYGSAAFIAGNKPAEYEVRVSTTGLLLRPVVHQGAP
jgi:hypothetical protein